MHKRDEIQRERRELNMSVLWFCVSARVLLYPPLIFAIVFHVRIFVFADVEND